jgi:hypothetical protein
MSSSKSRESFPSEQWIRMAGHQPCNCKTECGDVDDEEGVCKGLPEPRRQPLVEIVLVPRG